MLTHLALCHSIVVDDKSGKYNASSPDELALVNAAKFFGYQYISKDENGVLSIITVHGKLRKYKLLNTLEFNSTRKRMSVIIEDLQSPTSAKDLHDIYVLTKGADSIIQPLLNQQTSQFIDETYNYVTQYANEGLRTLILAQKKINRNEYEAWALRYNEALNKVNNRDEELELVSARMESGMELVGATAIEDKLQDGVSKEEDI
jgi:magnesium-transporting ATPase (P-type)